MSLANHLDLLHEKHNKLSKKIEDGYTHHINDAYLTKLKKKKLRLKDEIASLTKQVSNQN